MTAHSHAEIAQEKRRYLQVFAWLAVLTVLEVGVIYTPLHSLVIALILVVLASTKAALVALYYMHLSVERRTLTWVALTPAILCLILVFALLPDLGAITRALTHFKPTAAAPAHH